MKGLVDEYTSPVYPKYGQCFDVHTNASNLQIGEVVSQDKKTIVFFSQKFNSAQARYTTTEQELLAIVET